MAGRKPHSIDRFGRILIPKDLREAVGLSSGREVRIVAEDGELRLIPEPEEPLIHEVEGVKVFTGRLPPGYDAGAALDEDRQERMRHLIGRRRKKR